MPPFENRTPFMMRLITLFLISLLSTSCAEVRTLESPGKHRRYEVECTGKIVSMDVCYKKAAALCPQGYTILDHNVEKRNPFPIITPMGMGSALANEVPGVVKGINIECK